MSLNRFASKGLKFYVAVSLATVGTFTHATPASAQDPVRTNPAPVPPPSTPPVNQPTNQPTPADPNAVKTAIDQSGLTEAQIRDQLKAKGYDPKLADQYFGSQSGSNTPADNVEFVQALQAAGILTVGTTTTTNSPESLQADPARVRSGAFGVFGKDIFSTQSSAFNAALSSPVDALYRLNAGDQLQLIITGDVERAYTLDVRPDGSVVVPQVGVVSLAGLTLESARSLLRQKASRSFSALSDGTAKLDLSVSRVRTNVVFVVGEVERPGSYPVSGMATIFHALVQAGGPTSRGSFRDIQLRRGTEVLHIDLYDYLLRGDASRDVRTANGDIIFVPLNTRAVAIRGAVRRPGIFELKPQERFADLLNFAGGLLPTASSERLQIDRILPPEQRQPGKERVISDVKFQGRVASLDTVAIHDNDIVTAFSIGDVRRNNVQVEGEVYQPGSYEWHRGMTLGELLDAAQGVLPWALSDRIKVERPVAETGRTEIISIDLHDAATRNIPVNEFDVVTVLDARLAFPAGLIGVTGAVNRPSTLAYAEHQTLGDVIDLVGGLTEDAASIEISRRKIGASYTDTAAIISVIPVAPGPNVPAYARPFVLERGDGISVRRSPGFRSRQNITVSGLFAYPGLYTIQTDRERLRDIIRRAGGALPTAYAEAFRVIRDGQIVVLDYNEVMKGDKVQNIALKEGDQITIGPNPGTVVVSGAVVRPATFPYNPRWKAMDYVNAAGGLAPSADKNHVAVEYASGEVRTIKRVMNLPLESPDVRPGAVITVATHDASKDTNFGETLTRIAQIATTFMSIVIGYVAVTR